MQKTFHILISGRVQLVMYRDFCQRKARGLSIRGTVQNLEDGTVEVYAQGSEEGLNAYLEKLNKGPILARVESVRVREVQGGPVYGKFNILY